MITSDTPKSKIQSPKSALLVLVHGTPRPASNAPMWQVIEDVRSRNVYPIVEVGFMECNEPSIPEAIDACVSSGASEIIAVPYFLHTGTHVADDLPTLLEEGEARHPAIQFRQGDFLGSSKRLTDILIDRTKAVLLI